MQKKSFQKFGLFVLCTVFLFTGCTPEESKPTSLSAAQIRIESGLEIRIPQGLGPFPTILYFHGASDKAWYDAQNDILNQFVQNGFAAVFVNMYKGRNATSQTVRSGALLPRATAGDVMVALDWAEKQNWVAKDKIGLFGVSFGAATIMDSLVLDALDKMPTSLLEKPSQGLSGAKAAAFLSPWCSADVMGFNLIKSVYEDFSRQLPILAVLPQSDSVSDQPLCQSILERNLKKGTPIEIVKVKGAGHAFAQRQDDYGQAFADYNAHEAGLAWQKIIGFFKQKLN